MRVFDAIGLGFIGAMVLARSAGSQVVPDSSLGTLVRGDCAGLGGVCSISGGAQQGGNLFHSFEQFSLPNGDSANFDLSPDVQNALVRVTGRGQPFVSNLNGSIATSHGVNFWLMNPNGVIFGPNARLSLGGSLVATTASEMRFDDGRVWAVAEAQPLLSLSTPTGLQLGTDPGRIRLQDVALAANAGERFGSFENLALVGGDIVLSNSVILAPGRQIALVSADAGENVELTLAEKGWRFALQEGALGRDLRLEIGSGIDVVGAGGGGIGIEARNVSLRDASFLLAGLAEGSSPRSGSGRRAGEIRIHATQQLRSEGISKVRHVIQAGAEGQGGDLVVQVGGLMSLAGGSEWGSFILPGGGGKAGNVQVTAGAIALEGGSAEGAPSFVGSVVSPTGRGQGGHVAVRTDRLTITGGALVAASTFGLGDAGDVQVTAGEIALTGSQPDGSTVSGIFSESLGAAIGRGGEVSVTSDRLTIRDGAAISANTYGQGDGGNVVVRAGAIALEGFAANSGSSAITSIVAPTGRGQGGDVTVTSDSLRLSRGAGISASTFGQGPGGDVQVTAREIAIAGARPDGLAASGIFSETSAAALGRGGELWVNADRLEVTQGGLISATTYGQGNAGNVNVEAGAIALDGFDPQAGPSSIGSIVGPTASGKGGQINVMSDRLSLSNGAGISASTFGQGDAGNVEVTANGGITITGERADGVSSSGIFTASFDRRIAGNITLTTPQLSLDDRGLISTTSNAANGGDIRLNLAKALFLGPGAGILATAGNDQNPGDGGNIAVTVPFLIALPNSESDIIANAFSGSGGNITLNAKAIFNLAQQNEANGDRLRSNRTNDISASSQFGSSGLLNLVGLNVDPSRGAAELPQRLVDGENLIDRTCNPSTLTSNAFTASGRGGLPLTPTEPWSGLGAQVAWIALPEVAAAPHSTSSPALPSISRLAWTEAVDWQDQGQGRITLLGKVSEEGQHPMPVRPAPFRQSPEPRFCPTSQR